MNDKEPSQPAPETVPPLESSPAFQERVIGALGGTPSSPSSFQKIAPPKPVGPPATAGFAQAASIPHDPVFDGPSEELKKARALVAQLPARLAPIRAILSANLPAAQEIVAAIQGDKLAKAEADLQGIDMKSVEKFLEALSKAEEIKKK